MFPYDLSRYSNKVCLITEDRVYTYSEVDKVCQDIERQLPSGKKLIVVEATTNIETIFIYLGFLRSNHAFIMAATTNKQAIENIIKEYQPNYIWEKKDTFSNYGLSIGDYGLREINPEPLNLNPHLCLMLSTSGSTGSPKMVRLSKKAIFSNCDSIAEYLQIESDDVTITNLPLSYSYGLSIINTHIYNGASIIVSRLTVMQREFWSLCNKYKLSNLNCVPYSYEMLKRVGFMKMDIPSLKVLTQAGGKLNSKLVQEYALWARDNNIKFYVMYGQTEATARISYLSPDRILDRVSSIGCAIPGGKLHLQDIINGKLIEGHDIDGELVYTGNNVMLGYATCMEDLTKGDDLKNVLCTGDIAKRDKHGFYYITGRLKRMIKIYGNSYNLDDIEHHLKDRQFDAICTGTDDNLIIVSKNKSLLEDIKTNVSSFLNIHKSLIKTVHVDTYHISEAGKIQYNKILMDLNEL